MSKAKRTRKPTTRKAASGSAAQTAPGTAQAHAARSGSQAQIVQAADSAECRTDSGNGSNGAASAEMALFAATAPLDRDLLLKLIDGVRLL